MTGTEVVVTGLGATTPLGGDVATTWQALLDGRTGISALGDDWPEVDLMPVRVAARLAVEPAGSLGYVETKRLDRCEQLAMVAARQAWSDAGLTEGSVTPDRLAVVIGTGLGCIGTLLSQHDLLRRNGPQRVSPYLIPMVMPNGPAAHVGLALGARAGVHAPMSACAAGAEALAWAWRLLQAGAADVVVAGGAEACITPVAMAGFVRARSMSRDRFPPHKASRPFDIDRNGFVLGEGAGIMVLERAGSAAARGATVYGRLTGVGMSNDAYHITAPDPGHAGQTSAVADALRSGDLSPSDINHVNAHAASTPLGDLAESGTIRTAIGDHPVVTAPKGGLGHLLGASGAVEAIVTVLSVRERVVPPTVNLDNQDSAIELDVVAGKPRPLAITGAVSNSFGFGGHNVVLAFTPA
jgi:3-oxoacyl-[acyl-carrier-protein] synthase II